jgi:hypothetical protein
LSSTQVHGAMLLADNSIHCRVPSGIPFCPNAAAAATPMATTAPTRPARTFDPIASMCKVFIPATSRPWTARRTRLGGISVATPKKKFNTEGTEGTETRQGFTAKTQRAQRRRRKMGWEVWGANGQMVKWPNGQRKTDARELPARLFTCLYLAIWQFVHLAIYGQVPPARTVKKSITS